jgi:hypothetical protein
LLGNRVVKAAAEGAARVARLTLKWAAAIISGFVVI